MHNTVANNWFFHGFLTLCALGALALGAGTLHQFLHKSPHWRRQQYVPIAGCGGMIVLLLASGFLLMLITATTPWTVSFKYPLMIALFVTILGLAAFGRSRGGRALLPRRERGSWMSPLRRKRPPPTLVGQWKPMISEKSAVEGFTGAIALFLGSSMALIVLLSLPSDQMHDRIFEHLFKTPPERIQRLVIKSGGETSRLLTPADVVIDDPAQIKRIAEILATAKPIGIKHPDVKWRALVEMVTLDGTYYFGVTATTEGDRNGTIVSALHKPKGRQWRLGDVRADGLDRILEQCITAAPNH